MNTTTQQKNQRVVLVGGCFDFIHYGHVHFLTSAKVLGDRLIVALESDGNVRLMKGDNRPIHTQKQRKTMLEALSCVDEVICLPVMKSDTQYANLVKRVHPDIIAVTQDDQMMAKKKAHAHAIGATVSIIPKIHTPSTSQLTKLLSLE